MARFRILLAALAILAVRPTGALAQEDQVTPLPPLTVEEVPAASPTPEPSPAATAPPTADAPPAADAPSAEMIIDAEEEVLEEPAVDPGEQPLPPMDSDAPFPGEEDIFGADLFGGTDAFFPPMPDIPEVPPMIEDPKELERKMRVRLRRIKARLDRDPQLLDLQDMAARAPTPEDNRAARRAYYALFFDKVRKADPSLAQFADKTERTSLALLYQTRIEPTVPLNPPPQPQPQERFIPKQQFPDVLPPDEESIPLP
jgi:hypothetical protein